MVDSIAKTISLLNNFVQERKSIEQISPFEAANGYYEGKIRVITRKALLEFRVQIPDCFPLANHLGQSIQFRCPELGGMPHASPGSGTLCLHPQPSRIFLAKLRHEFALFLQWIRVYYEQEKVDDHYEYLQIPGSSDWNFLFTDVEKTFSPGEFGSFEYVPSGMNGLFWVQDIGASTCEWSSQLLKKEINNQRIYGEGLWIFLDDEPTSNRRIPVSTWKELGELLPSSFTRILDKLKVERKRGKRKLSEFLPILLGFSIPSENLGEIHWEVVVLDCNNFPFYGRKIEGGYETEFSDVALTWGKTRNCTYSRFFGRGKLAEDLSSKKIAIIGLGALGSNLAETLTRGGVKHLSLSDNDVVEPGNLCRANFDIIDVGVDKNNAIARRLAFISPFLEIEVMPLLNRSKNPIIRSKTKKFLSQYDFIFDCTANPELSCYLDQVKPDSHLLNLSISNEANELVCIYGNEAITSRKEALFESLDTAQDIEFMGTGCWHPTFKAKDSDIKALLNTAISQIDLFISQNSFIKSFVVQKSTVDNSLQLKTYVF